MLEAWRKRVKLGMRQTRSPATPAITSRYSASDSSRRPKLIVNYGSSTSTSTSSSGSTSTSANAATADSAGDITLGPGHVTKLAGKWVVVGAPDIFDADAVPEGEERRRPS